MIKKVKEEANRGDFLTEEHTLHHLRRGEFWEPLVSIRSSYEEWKRKGGLDAVENAREKAKEILRTYEPSQPETGIQEELSMIIEDFEERVQNHVEVRKRS